MKINEIIKERRLELGYTQEQLGALLNLSSSFIQTILSALEFHQIMPFGSWAIPPVGNYTLP